MGPPAPQTSVASRSAHAGTGLGAVGHRMAARNTLLVRLFILVLAATFPAVLVMVALQTNLRADGRARIAEQALRQADLLNADLGTVVEGARQLSLALTHFPPVKAGDRSCRNDLVRLHADLPAYAVLSVMAEDGRVICSSAPDVPAMSDAGSILRTEGALQEGQFSTGLFTQGKAEERAALPFRMPFVTDEGELAVATVSLSLDWLTEHLDASSRPAGSVITVTDSGGTVLVRLPRDPPGIGRPAPATLQPLVLAPKRGTANITGRDGNARIIGFVPATVRPMGLFVGFSVNIGDLLADTDRATLAGWWLIGVGAMASLLLALLVGQRFVRRPTALLLAAARRWSAGDLDARADLPESAHTEFGSLAGAFNDMAAALGRRRDEMAELNATLEARVTSRTRDLTDSRNRLQVEMGEREKTEATLHQAQKLQAVGQLAGGIAHDFNNLLTTIIGALDLLRTRLRPEEAPLTRLVENALRAAERGGRLTGQLLAFSRRQRLLPVATDMNATVTALTDLLGSTLGRAVRIETELAEGLWPAMVDPAQIEAAILNLAINARDAMPEGGVLTLFTGNVQLGDGEGARAGDYAAIHVRDTGTGMTPEVMARVFEPFFTTKEPGRGSGLGLSQVHGMAVQSGGTVRVDSRVGGGTTITLLLPRSANAPARAPAARTAAARVRRGTKVMVVDDETEVRAIVCEMLTERGYRVTPMADSAAALAALDEGAACDLLLADHVMPGMDGATLIREARRRRPGQRALLMTGTPELGPDMELDDTMIIRKPFTIAELDARLEQMLQPDPAGQ